MKTKKILIVGLLCMSLMVIGIMSSASAATITITPDTLPKWTTLVNSTLTPAEVADLVGYSNIPPLSLLYKQNAGVGGTEEGQYASSYETTFIPLWDPESATIIYVGGDSITVDPLYLLVKDGNHEPAQYIFDLNDLKGVAWNGTDTLSLEGFWPDRGSISNISIYGPSTSVPEPSTMLLLGSGLLGLWGIRRKFNK